MLTFNLSSQVSITENDTYRNFPSLQEERLISSCLWMSSRNHYDFSQQELTSNKLWTSVYNSFQPSQTLYLDNSGVHFSWGYYPISAEVFHISESSCTNPGESWSASDWLEFFPLLLITSPTLHSRRTLQEFCVSIIFLNLDYFKRNLFSHTSFITIINFM